MKCEMTGTIYESRQQCVKNGKCFVRIDFDGGKSDWVMVPEQFYLNVQDNQKVKITIETL